MPDLDSPYAVARLSSFVLAGVLVILTGVIAWRLWRHSRVSPEQRERLRRAWLVSTGKMGDANLLEIRDNVVFYTYAVRGVEYTATQDISRLADKVPADLSQAPSLAVKYDPKNPANSIVLAEEWSGMHRTRV